VTLARLWAFLAVALPTLGALIASLPSVDLAYQLRAGSEILDSRAIPSSDTWTFTARGTPWTDQQWGAQVILAAVYQLGGWTGLVLLRAILVAVIFGCLFGVGVRRGLGARQAAWLTLAAFVVSAAALGLRPQLFGMALLAVVLLLVVGRRTQPRGLWAVPILVLLSANIHGSFFLGPLVLGLAWLEDLHDHLARPHQGLIVAVVSVAAACLTPFGPAVWSYALGLSFNPEVTRRITEWQPTSLRDGVGILFFASVLAVVALIARRGRPTSWPSLAWLGVFFVIGAYAARGVAWWPLGAVAAIAGWLAAPSTGETNRLESAGTPSMRRLNVVVAGAIILTGVALMPIWRPMDPGLRAPRGVVANAPPGITATLRDLVRADDRLFNPQPWGSWFEFAMPDLPVAIDSRIELFPVDIWNAYDRIASGQDGWETQLDAWGVTIAVVGAGNPGLAGRLVGIGWESVYSDVDGSILLAPDR
jgi:hypothetical protein